MLARINALELEQVDRVQNNAFCACGVCMDNDLIGFATLTQPDAIALCGNAFNRRAGQARTCCFKTLVQMCPDRVQNEDREQTEQQRQNSHWRQKAPG